MAYILDLCSFSKIGCNKGIFYKLNELFWANIIFVRFRSIYKYKLILIINFLFYKRNIIDLLIVTNVENFY